MSQAKWGIRVARGATIAALYVALCWALAPISYGWVQLRVAEALTVLPILWPEAIPALYLGTMVANILGGLGAIDIFGGSLVTLAAACLTRLTRHSWLAYLWPVLLNALLLSLYLSALAGVPYWATALSIGASEAVVVLALGAPLIRVLRRRFKPEEPDTSQA